MQNPTSMYKCTNSQFRLDCCGIFLCYFEEAKVMKGGMEFSKRFCGGKSFWWNFRQVGQKMERNEEFKKVKQ